MSERTRPPFRADHVGSLLRPPELLEAREAHAAGRLDDDGLKQAEDEAIRDVVRMQEEAGLRSVTDGEFRRASWHMDFIYSLDGVSKAPGNLSVQFHNAEGDIEFTPAALHIDGKLGVSRRRSSPRRSSSSSRSRASGRRRSSRSRRRAWSTTAAAAPLSTSRSTPTWTASGPTSPRPTPRRSGASASSGCTYLQFDDTSLAYLNDPRQREMIAAQGSDAEHLHESYISHINEALAQRPQGMAVTTHMCRGNFRSSWVAEGGYDFVAEALFGELDVDGFFMEWDDARSGGFEPLRFVPKGKQVVLGLVTTKRGELESKDDLKRRIEEASQYVDVDQLCLSPQCGFSSTVEGNVLSREQQAAKLALIVETAKEVWG